MVVEVMVTALNETTIVRATKTTRSLNPRTRVRTETRT